MPSRSRGVGPEVSRRYAVVFRARREEAGLSMPELSGQMYAAGYQMSAAVINAIENGVSSWDPETETTYTRDRLITLDEAEALAKVLGITITIPEEEQE